MKRDDARAELLATALEGGPVADEIESLLPAVGRLRALLADLEPSPDHVSFLLPRLYSDHMSAQRLPSVRLAHPTLSVRDMEAALRFYRDVLGLRPRSEGTWFSELEAGGAGIALQWTGSSTRLPHVGDVCIEFRADDLGRAVETLRRLGMRVALGRGRRGAYAELHDPDGHTIHLVGSLAASRSVEEPVETRSAAGEPRE
jgi:catechol 2,3-dioxygenase-like lactoylglutathione lyase family enzyme